VHYIYDPYRVLKPLKRVGSRALCRRFFMIPPKPRSALFSSSVGGNLLRRVFHVQHPRWEYTIHWPPQDVSFLSEFFALGASAMQLPVCAPAAC
jgi:hypothetical protein